MTQPTEPSPTPSPSPSPTGDAPPPPPPADRPPSTDWREPPWFPPRDRGRRVNWGAIVFGLIILGIGVYYFLDRTLGIALPRIQWGSIWPIFLIILGGLILLRSFDRR